MVFGHALKGDLILPARQKVKLVGSLFVGEFKSGSQAVGRDSLEFAADPLICFDSPVDSPFRWLDTFKGKIISVWCKSFSISIISSRLTIPFMMAGPRKYRLVTISIFFTNWDHNP